MATVKQYQVVNQAVEINGITRRPGEILKANDFKKASGKDIDVVDENHNVIGKEKEKGELESLLATGHVIEV